MIKISERGRNKARRRRNGKECEDGEKTGREVEEKEEKER